MKWKMQIAAGVTLVLMVSVLMAGSAIGGTVDSAVPEVGVLLPDDPGYWVKSDAEALGLIVFEGTDAEVGFLAELAGERLAEVVCYFKEGMIPEAEARLELYREKSREMTTALERVRERAGDPDEEAEEEPGDDEEDGEEWLSFEEVLQRVEEATQKHIAVLQGVLEKVPEQARGAISRAMEVSMQGRDAAVGALQEIGQRPGAVPPYVPQPPRPDESPAPPEEPDVPQPPQPDVPQPPQPRPGR